MTNRDKRHAHSLPILAEKALTEESELFPGASTGEVIVNMLCVKAQNGGVEAAKVLCRLIKLREQEKQRNSANASQM